MHDIKAIREQRERYQSAWEAKGHWHVVDRIIERDNRRREMMTGLETSRAARADLSRQFGQAKTSGDQARIATLSAELEKLKNAMSSYDTAEFEATAELTALLESLPNIPAPEVPVGKDESDNEEVRRWLVPKTTSFAPKDHVDLGAPLGMDFEAAARMSGTRFVVLHGQLAKLERAIGQFMLDLQTSESHGFNEVSPPLLVRDDAMFGTGQLPKFADDLFRTTDGRWLIPTAEVSLTNIVREQILDPEKLPLRFTALTPSFRAEAGSAGRDTRGMIRQHQFYKVELVSITTPDKSEFEHQHMLQCAEAVLKALELPFRTMLLCSGDMGFSARKTYDLEVWLPSQNTYREISSCSNCGDFQARRMDARFKRPAGFGEGSFGSGTYGKKTEFLHTLNGSGLAVGRTLVAVMENYQQADGSIAIPAALQPYMGGLTSIGGSV